MKPLRPLVYQSPKSEPGLWRNVMEKYGHLLNTFNLTGQKSSPHYTTLHYTHSFPRVFPSVLKDLKPFKCAAPEFDQLFSHRSWLHTLAEVGKHHVISKSFLKNIPWETIPLLRESEQITSRSSDRVMRSFHFVPVIRYVCQHHRQLTDINPVGSESRDQSEKSPEEDVSQLALALSLLILAALFSQIESFLSRSQMWTENAVGVKKVLTPVLKRCENRHFPTFRSFRPPETELVFSFITSSLG